MKIKVEPASASRWRLVSCCWCRDRMVSGVMNETLGSGIHYQPAYRPGSSPLEIRLLDWSDAADRTNAGEQRPGFPLTTMRRERVHGGCVGR